MSKWLVKVNVNNDENLKQIIFVIDNSDRTEVPISIFSYMFDLGFQKEQYKAEYQEFNKDGTLRSNS